MRKMVAAWAVLALAGEIFCLSQVAGVGGELRLPGPC